ncbi:hypothetical protein DW66_3701 [Pseudomonas putida]|nr:hypothetical protein DW66_3701 [Pseudomonas putida]AJG12870.1 hypothetical protein RK21_01362 [Pseudomonas plecoglossicida]
MVFQTFGKRYEATGHHSVPFRNSAGPVGAGSPANALVASPSHSRVNPLLQGPAKSVASVF